MSLDGLVCYNCLAAVNAQKVHLLFKANHVNDAISSDNLRKKVDTKVNM